MKAGLIGVTGFVGSAFLYEALQCGHEVRAIVRLPHKVQSHPKLCLVKDDVYNVEDVARLIWGYDVMIGVFNPGWGSGLVLPHPVSC